MKKRLSLILCIATVAAAVSGCGDVVVHDTAKRQGSTGESWTIMMYMCGSTLEEEHDRAGEVLRSLAYDLPENVNVLVETGGSREWSIEDVDNEYLQYYAVQKNGIRLVEQKTSASMGESSTLSEFMDWSAKNYPADHYMTVIWDHGGGPLGGVAYDARYEFDSLSTKELKTALGNSGITLDLIGFDASLTSNLETASAVSLYADYMVGAEDIMPMSGWDYEDLFGFISEYPNAGPAAVGQRICEGAAEKADEDEEKLLSMAVVDLSKETMLSLAFDGAAQTMDDATGDISSLAALKTSLNELEPLGGNTKWEGYSDMIDMGRLVDALGKSFGSPAANLKKALNEAVIFSSAGELRNGMSGMGIYYPMDHNGEKIARYRDIASSARYVEYLEKTCIDTDVPDRGADITSSGAFNQYSALAQDNTISAVTDFEGRFIMAPTHPELITGVYVNLYKYSEKDEKYIYLCSDYNTYFDQARGGYVYEFSGKIPQLNGTNVTMYPVSRGAEYDIYSIPVMYDGVMMNIRAIRSNIGEDEGKYSVFGMWKGTDPFNGMADRKVRKLRTGDVMIPVYEVYGEGGSSYIEGSRVKVGLGDMKLSERKIANGDYALSFTAEDIYGIKHESNTAALTVTKGNIKLSMNYMSGSEQGSQ